MFFGSFRNNIIGKKKKISFYIFLTISVQRFLVKSHLYYITQKFTYMNPTIKLTALLVSSALFFTGCNKSDNEIDGTNLPKPIEIQLRSTESEILKTDRQFAFEFFANVFNEEALDEDKSFMVSPFSLSMALAMTWNGAAAETKTAMQQTLKMGGYSDNDVNGYYKKVKEALLKTDPSTKLSIANSIFTNKFVTIKPDFIKTNTDYYDATVQPVDF